MKVNAFTPRKKWNVTSSSQCNYTYVNTVRQYGSTNETASFLGVTGWQWRRRRI